MHDACEVNFGADDADGEEDGGEEALTANSQPCVSKLAWPPLLELAHVDEESLQDLALEDVGEERDLGWEQETRPRAKLPKDGCRRSAP